MCIECGCEETTHLAQDHEHSHHHEHGPKTLRIEEDLLSKNNRLAGQNRQMFREQGVFVLNLVSSPGSGKTTLLENTISALAPEMRIAVLEEISKPVMMPTGSQPPASRSNRSTLEPAATSTPTWSAMAWRILTWPGPTC